MSVDKRHDRRSGAPHGAPNASGSTAALRRIVGASMAALRLEPALAGRPNS